MRPRISSRGFVRPSVRISICTLVIQKTAEKGDFGWENRGGHVLVHFGRVLLPARAYSF